VGLNDWASYVCGNGGTVFGFGSLSFSFSFSLAAFTRALERRFRGVGEDDEASCGTCSELELLDSGLCWDKSI
jgi:hypothetical protein